MFCANEINILSSKKKIEFLRPLESALSQKSDLPTLKLLTRNKGDADATNFINVATVMKKSKNVRVNNYDKLHTAVLDVFHPSMHFCLHNNYDCSFCPNLTQLPSASYTYLEAYIHFKGAGVARPSPFRVI